VCAFVAYSQAQKKGLNAGLWAFIGLVFGVFGVIASLIAKPKGAKAATNSMGTTAAGGSMGSASSAMAGGALGAAAATGLNPAQQNAMNNLREMAQEKIDEQNQEEEDSSFDAGDMDF
jgi:hypothetical protein